jgi:hypothetical protein
VSETIYRVAGDRMFRIGHDFLIFVADSPRVRHYCEKSAIKFENLQVALM